MKRAEVDILVGTHIMGWEYDEGVWLVEGQQIRKHFHPTTNLLHTWEMIERIASPPHTLEDSEFTSKFSRSSLWAFKREDAAFFLSLIALQTHGVDIQSEDIE